MYTVQTFRLQPPLAQTYLELNVVRSLVFFVFWNPRKPYAFNFQAETVSPRLANIIEFVDKESKKYDGSNM